MRLKNILRSTIAGGASLALATGLVACSRDYTVAYVYAISASSGNINAFGVDYETGILNQITGSPFTSTLSNPTTIVAAPNNKFVYVVGGNQNAQVEEYAVGTDGKLYGQHTYSLTGTEAAATNGTGAPIRVGATIDSTGTFLYVTFAYQVGFSSASPGPGGLTVFPINSDNSLGTPFTVNVGNNPVGVAVSTPVCTNTPIISSNPTCTGVSGSGGAGNYNVYVYVLDQELQAGKPNILGFAQNMTNGSLTPLIGTTVTATGGTGYSAGVTPSAIAVDGTARYVYVTDQAQNEVLGYGIARSTTGALTPLSGSPFGTGQFPIALTIDPRSDFLYTANFNSSTISGFAINQQNGNLSTVAGSTFTTATGPTCVSVEPALGIFLFTSNYLDGSVSAGKLNANTGVVDAVADTPFPSSQLPTCVTSVANGAHSTSVLTP